MNIPKILTEKADETEAKLKEIYQELAPFFKKCFLNTIETTVTPLDDGSYFVITGDIPAMWLRDSAAQLKPYIRFAPYDDGLKEIFRGVIARQSYYVNIDPYSNAWCASKTNNAADDKTDFYNDLIWERKYECMTAAAI